MTQTQRNLFGAVLTACATLSVAACGGGGSSGGGGVINPTPTPVPPGGPQVYVTEESGTSSSTTPNLILSFSIAAILGGQSISPTIVLGSNAFSDIPSIALDGVKNMYVVDQPTATVLEFAAGSSGSAVAPLRTITSPALSAPYGIAVGPAGNIYVSDPTGGALANGAIDIFAGSQSGTVNPIRQITGVNSQLNQPVGIALDGSGNVWVTNDAQSSSGLPSVEEFGPNSSTPIRVISGQATGLSAPVAIALDSASNIYVANSQANSVTVYGPNASGNQPPIRVLSGTTSGIALPEGLAFDLAGNLYVTNLQFTSVPGTLNVYSPGTGGNTAPIAELTGGSSVTFNPVGVGI